MMQEIKMLYKYLSPERFKNVLVDNRIRFTQASCFNDPFEVLPYIESLVSKDLFSKFTDLIKEKAKHIDESFVNDRMLKLENLFTSPALNFNVPFSEMLRKEFDNKYGILSLSKNFKNIVMWSHYSKDHTGFIIGFNNSLWKTEFKSLDTYYYKELFKVTYDIDRPKYHSFISKELFDEDGMETFFKTILTTKSTQWKNENEYRIIADTKGATSSTLKDENDKPIYLFDIPPSYIDLIVLGKYSKEPDFDYMAILDKPEYSHIKLYKSALDEKEYKLKYIKVK